MKKYFLRALLATGLLAVQLSASAEDIDLFVGRTPTPGELPNVLFILDSTANWNTAFTAEVAALKTTFENMAVNADGSAKFNVGLMMFAESPVKGAYIRAAIRPMTGPASTNYRQKYADLINSFDKIQDKGANALYAYSMAEAYRYFKGMTEYVGADEPKRDYLNNPTGTAQSVAVHALTGNAFSNSADKIYDKASSVAGCAKNFIIYISNGKVDNSDKEGTSPTCNTNLKSCTAQQLLALEGGDTTRLLISPAGEANNMSDEWAKFMKSSSLGVTTYTIDVGTPDADHTALLKSMAVASEGRYFAASAASTDEIANAVNDALTEIQAVNSVFASVSLPVSVNTQGSYRNQVFIGMFRPDGDAFPRWQGNLKQYKLDFVSNVLKLVDADGVAAINSGTGFITGCARSFWTPSTVDTYWAFSPQNNCLTVASSASSNYPDGNIVEKGAQAYVLRSSTTRTVKTCSATMASCTALTDFNNTNVTQAMLGAASTTERDALIDWAKGLDIQNEDNDLLTTTEMRPSAHGDIVHSRPVAINFGTEELPQVVVFYGGNDGMLRAVNGNRLDAIGSVAAGAELWSFMPPEFYGGIKRLYDNTTQINFPGNTTGTPTPLPKPYGVDGPIIGYQPDASLTWLYATMRRGGRVLYAFDVSDPASPSLKWKRGCPNNFTSAGVVDDTGCLNDTSSGGVGDWRAIGQTWSAPKVIKAGGYVTSGPTPTNKPMLIMGGGYDTCHDSDPNTSCSSTSKGNKIYLLDADDGKLQQTFSTESSVVGEVTVVPDANGLATYIYAADLGGNVYRISGATANTPIGTTAPGNWTITRIAVLGGTGVDNRKFMFAPDVVDNNNGIYSILLGSGDREKPLLSYTAAASVNNYFFMLQDKPAATTWLTSELASARCAGNYLCLDSLSAIAADGGNPVDLDTHKGWRLGLKPNEQIVTSAITVFDTVTFSAHRPFGSLPAEPGTPESPACGPDLGVAKVYNVNFANAAPIFGTSRSELIHGGGLPPSPVAGMVRLDNGQIVPFLIGGTGVSPLEGGTPPAPSSAVRPKSRAYWYIQK